MLNDTLPYNFFLDEDLRLNMLIPQQWLVKLTSKEVLEDD